MTYAGANPVQWLQMVTVDRNHWLHIRQADT